MLPFAAVGPDVRSGPKSPQHLDQRVLAEPSLFQQCECSNAQIVFKRISVPRHAQSHEQRGLSQLARIKQIKRLVGC